MAFFSNYIYEALKYTDQFYILEAIIMTGLATQEFSTSSTLEKLLKNKGLCDILDKLFELNILLEFNLSFILIACNLHNYFTDDL